MIRFIPIPDFSAKVAHFIFISIISDSSDTIELNIFAKVKRQIIMKKTILFILLSMYLVGCESDEPIKNDFLSDPLDKEVVVLQGNKIDSATIHVKTERWDLAGISFFPGDIEHIKHVQIYEKITESARYLTACDTLSYDWIKIAKTAPQELMVVVQKNPTSETRTATVIITGSVGLILSGGVLTVIQNGSEE